MVVTYTVERPNLSNPIKHLNEDPVSGLMEEIVEKVRPKDSVRNCVIRVIQSFRQSPIARC
jgi:hypothetical protein